MPPRDELLLIIDLTSTIIRAGVGVHDLIRGPLAVSPLLYHPREPSDALARPAQEITTRIARRTSAVAPYKITDYVVGNAFAAAEAAGEELDVLTPMTVGPLGLEVNDWTGLEAIMHARPRFLLFPPKLILTPDAGDTSSTPPSSSLDHPSPTPSSSPSHRTSRPSS